MHCPKQEAKLGLNSCSKFGVLFSVGCGQINAIDNYKYKIVQHATIRHAFRNSNDKISLLVEDKRVVLNLLFTSVVSYIKEKLFRAEY